MNYYIISLKQQVGGGHSDLRFCINEGSKRSESNEKGTNKITNRGEIWYKMIQNCQMRDFGETLGKLWNYMGSRLPIFSAQRGDQCD